MAKTLSTSLAENLSTIKTALGNSSDIVVREFIIGEEDKIKAAMIYVDGITDKTFIQEFILKALMFEVRKVDLKGEDLREKGWFQILKDFSISVADVKEVEDIDALYLGLSSGDTVILLDSYNKVLLASSRGAPGRGVNEPTSQTLVRGPKEGFTETLRTNTALLRKRIKNKNLRIETVVLGKESNTDIAIVYIDGLADETIVNDVKNRINKIDVDYILESGAVEELIQDSKYSIFSTVYNTERVDSLASGVLQGRVGILVDGTPFALLVPALFVHFFQSPEDYTNGFIISSFIRLLRYAAYFISLLTPAVYVALLEYHQEMLPTPLFISILAQREGVPFPAPVEVVLLEMIFEILRESAIRMPRIIGTTISIVGALVLGQASIEAGIFSPILIIAIAVTAIANNISPSVNMGISARMLRFIFILLASVFGIPGIGVGGIILFTHLCSLKSFGVPYLSSLAPFKVSAQKDTALRLPSNKVLKHEKN
ncbi:spore germination protein KA [Clostridium polyendosporum]|uniref:Spore germination protein KA n=1 Tax=Clostridium polyendosporum TaxID=69208 RepID=A0A919RYQ5_9CLOT|nr:spore germination protein [Clostridium polyendosporum]GIM28219.1 spore germination protein KA [Clostridium polyendosporum]